MEVDGHGCRHLPRLAYVGHEISRGSQKKRRYAIQYFAKPISIVELDGIFLAVEYLQRRRTLLLKLNIICSRCGGHDSSGRNMIEI